MAHIRQSRPDYGLGFHVKVLKTVSSCCLFTWEAARTAFFQALDLYWRSPESGYVRYKSRHLGARACGAATKRIWHIQDSQGQILALSARSWPYLSGKSPSTHFQVFPLRSEAARTSGQLGQSDGPPCCPRRLVTVTLEVWAWQPPRVIHRNTRGLVPVTLEGRSR